MKYIKILNKIYKILEYISYTNIVYLCQIKWNIFQDSYFVLNYSYDTKTHVKFIYGLAYWHFVLYTYCKYLY